MNEARTHAETNIDTICEENQLRKPRIYRRVARKGLSEHCQTKEESKKMVAPNRSRKGKNSR
jgi:hypothetical protein